jgi:hypothetical protein
MAFGRLRPAHRADGNACSGDERNRPGMRRDGRADGSAPCGDKALTAARGQGRRPATMAAALTAGFATKAA